MGVSLNVNISWKMNFNDKNTCFGNIGAKRISKALVELIRKCSKMFIAMFSLKKQRF
jgi:hypothetical protein